MPSEIERRINALEQRAGIGQTVALGFRCEHCGKWAATLDEAEVCGHHQPPPPNAFVVTVAFGEEL